MSAAMTALHYSGPALVRHCGQILLAIAVVLADALLHAGGFPHVFGLGTVGSAALGAAALYLAVVTMVLTLGLVSHGATALAQDDDGILLRSAWRQRQLRWDELDHILLDERQTKFTRFFIVKLLARAGIQRSFTVDIRLLTETIDQVGNWVDRAEQARIAHGGAPFVPPDRGFFGWVEDRRAADVAAARQSSRV